MLTPRRRQNSDKFYKLQVSLHTAPLSLVCHAVSAMVIYPPGAGRAVVRRPGRLLDGAGAPGLRCDSLPSDVTVYPRPLDGAALGPRGDQGPGEGRGRAHPGRGKLSKLYCLLLINVTK
jgi:hypothetical protein